MQKCRICGRNIKYIATSSSESVTCDAEKLRFVTEFGRITYGYLLHDCFKQGIENASSSDNGKN